MSTTQSASAPPPTFVEALRFWLKLGFISFGGPTGQIAIMHRELVERRQWISEERFVHALNYCMLLPGPEAQQLATYIGWLLHRTLGGVVAGVLFVLPSAFILWALSWVYVSYGQQPWLMGILAGLKPAVVAIVVGAAWRIGTRVLKNSTMWSVAALAFVAIAGLHTPFPIIILIAATVGYLGGRFQPARFAVLKSHGAAIEVADHVTATPRLGRTVCVLATCLALWWLPVLAVVLCLGQGHVLSQEGLFFSKAALVTVGGAYAVLPYVSQQAVERFAWVTPGEMLDGLGMAETTPGPLIMVLQFVGFLGAWRTSAPLSPLAGATLGAAMTTWTTFAPSFLFILVGAPYVERMRNNVQLTAALSAVTAAVVGVILNLAVWFGCETLLPPGGNVNVFGILVALGAFVLLQKLKWEVIPVVAIAAVAGLAVRLLGWA